jgi:hypothetical protein
MIDTNYPNFSDVQSLEELKSLLGALVNELERRDQLLPNFPYGQNYFVSGTVPTTVTLDTANPGVTAVTNVVAKLLTDGTKSSIIFAKVGS